MSYPKCFRSYHVASTWIALLTFFSSRYSRADPIQTGSDFVSLSQFPTRRIPKKAKMSVQSSNRIASIPGPWPP
jgi:hypothetical protein